MSKQDLKDAYAKFNEKNTFVPGDIVEWKQGFKNKKTTGPFVVVEVLPHPVSNNNDESGSAYFREPLDIILGHTDSDGDFICYHYDSRRFQMAD